MALTPGTRLGPYEIVAPLGSGGMGEVFRARDTRLGRDVAVKVLPQNLSANPELRARFEREAKTVSSLNHPHICTLFDVGLEGDTDYLVMELVEGETLAQRLAKGALPAADVLRLGAQIADALDRAHRAGVIHRDLKPANVMLAKSGAKLMDFGLARATGMSEPSGGSGLTQAALTRSPTVAAPLTAEGTIVGTFQYMAPEQLEGREADARSDIWALGCVFYEMATGKRAFEGRSQASLIATIMNTEPAPLGTLAPLAPPAFERLVRQCIAKDPDDRWQSAGDLSRELLWIADAGSRAGVPAPVSAQRASRERIAWLLATALAVVAGTSLFLALHSGNRSGGQMAFRQLSYRPMAIFRAAFAPDGKTIVYSAAREGNTPEIFTVRPEYPEPQTLGLQSAQLLSVSSTGELAVLTGARYLAHRVFTGTLARMPLGGGAPREILENVREADWSPDGSQLAIIRSVQGKDRLEYPIGHVLCESGGYVSDLRVSPRGDRVAYFEHPSRWDDRGSLNVVDLHGRKTVLSGGYWGEEGIAWTRDGAEVLFSASYGGYAWTMYAVTLAGKRRVALESAGGLTIHDVARDGRWLATRDDQRSGIMVHTPESRDDRDLSWLDLSEAAILSQDGRTVVFCEASAPMGNDYAVGLRKTDGSPVVRLGDGTPTDLSSDGKSVLAVVASTPPQVVIYPTGAGEPRRLDRGKLENIESAQWFPNGDSVLICGNEPGRATRFYVQNLAGAPPRGVTPPGNQ